MADGLAESISHDKHCNRQSYDGKDEVESMVIIDDKFAFQQMLNKVSEVLDHHCCQTCCEPYKGSQNHHKLLLCEILGPPDKEP